MTANQPDAAIYIAVEEIRHTCVRILTAAAKNFKLLQKNKTNVPLLLCQ
jgi:hypothetical protein